MENQKQSLRLLKAEEVALILNISRAFAYQLMQSSQIPTVRLGRAVRVRPQDLDRYISRNITDPEHVSLSG